MEFSETFSSTWIYFKKNLRLFLNLSLYVGKHTSSKHRDGATETLLETDVLGGLGIAQSKCKCD